MKDGSGRATVYPDWMSQTSSEMLNSGISPRVGLPQGNVYIFHISLPSSYGDVGSFFVR